METYKRISRKYFALFNLRDKLINAGVPMQYRLTDGGIEDLVETFGFAKTLEIMKGLQ